MAKLNSTTIYGALNVFSDVDIDGNLEVNGNLIVNGEIFKLSSILNVNASEFSYNGHSVWHEGNFNPDNKADKSHEHTKADITDFPTKLSEFENDKNFISKEELENVGYGDMMKSIYDKDDDGRVDRANLADEALLVDWAAVDNKPETFPPTDHSHSWSQITGKPSTFTPSSHSHSWDSITGKPSTFTPSSHNHDDRYYTESEIDAKLSEKSNTNHTHTWSSITGKPSTFTPSSHTHKWADITDPPKTYEPSKHGHSVEEITGNWSTTRLVEPDYVRQGIANTRQPLFDVLRADRTAFLPADQIIIEQSTDGGKTWTSADVSDSNKRKLFTGQRPNIRIPLKNGVKSTDCMLRITITGMKYDVPAGTPETQKYNYWNANYVKSTERYFNFEDGWVWLNSNSDRIHLTVERATGAKPNDWVKAGEAFMSGWSGGNYFKITNSTFGGGHTQVNNYWNWRFTFRTCSPSNTFNDADLSDTYTTSAQAIQHIKTAGKAVYTSSNQMMYNDHIYSWDEYKHVTFPESVNAKTFYATGDSGGERYEVYHEGHKPDWSEITNRPTKLSQFTNDSNFITSSSLTWNNISGKPSSFPPSSHSHSWSEITSKPSWIGSSKPTYSWSEITNRPTKLSQFTNDSNFITSSSLTWNNISGKPSSFPPSSHSHSWSQITGKPTTFPPTSHNHNEYMEVKLLWRGNTSVSRSSTYPTSTYLGSGNYVDDWDAFLIEWSSYEDDGSYSDNEKTRNISLVKVGSDSDIDSSFYNAFGGISFAYDTMLLGITGCTVYGNQSYLYFKYSKQVTFNENGGVVFGKSGTYYMRIKRVWGVRMKDSRY